MRFSTGARVGIGGVVGDGGDVVGHRGGVGGVGDVGGLDGGAGGDGDEVLDGGAGHLGDYVAVLNIDGDNLDLRVVDAPLGDDLAASVLDGGGQLGADGVGDGQVGDGGGGLGNKGRGVSHQAVVAGVVEGV